MPIPEPETVTRWSEEYIPENDPLAAFIEDECVLEYGAKGRSAELYNAYADWCAKNRVDPKSQVGFSNTLGGRFKRVKTMHGNIWSGIRLKSTLERPDDE